MVSPPFPPGDGWAGRPTDPSLCEMGLVGQRLFLGLQKVPCPFGLHLQGTAAAGTPVRGSGTMFAPKQPVGSVCPVDRFATASVWNKAKRLSSRLLVPGEGLAPLVDGTHCLTRQVTATPCRQWGCRV